MHIVMYEPWKQKLLLFIIRLLFFVNKSNANCSKIKIIISFDISKQENGR